MEASSPIAGKCYFVSDDRPVVLWKWIDELLSALSLPVVRRSLPLGAAKLIGGLLECVYHNFNISSEPPMTRFLACQLATSHYFNISRAKKDFAYYPVMTPEEGLEKLIQSYQVGR
jgi:nucleoside-diphosphate-sugar epimerase